jgi:hypothetical protein
MRYTRIMIAGSPSKLADSSVSANCLRTLAMSPSRISVPPGPCDHRDVGEPALVLAALVGPHQHLAGDRLDPAARHLQRRLGDLLGDGVEREPVDAHLLARHLDRDLPGRRAREVDLRDPPVGQELIADLLRQVAQDREVLLPVHDHRQHLGAVGHQADDRALGLLRQADDPVDRALDVGQRLLLVGLDRELGADVAAALGRGRDHALDPVDPADPLLDREDDALLDLRRARAGVGHRDRDQVELGLREHLLLDLQAHQQAADQQEEHQQVGGDRVLRHPGDRAGPDVTWFARHGDLRHR